MLSGDTQLQNCTRQGLEKSHLEHYPMEFWFKGASFKWCHYSHHLTDNGTHG